MYKKQNPSARTVYITYAGGTYEKSCSKMLKNALLQYRLPKSSGMGQVEYKPEITIEKPDIVTLDILREDERNLLVKSDILIVVCSEAAKASKRVHEQIELFRRIGKGDRILTLLVSGEPHDSFPENLFGSFLYRYADDAGNMIEETKTSEPLAADIRASNLLLSFLRLREEKLRLIAQIVGCSFDGLKQRYWLRKRQLYSIAGSMIVFLGLIFCIFLLKQSRDILQRRDTIQSSSEFVTDQLLYYLSDLPSRFDENPEAAKIMNENICVILRDLQQDMNRGKWGAKNAFSALPLDEILKINPGDTAENVILKACIYRMDGNRQAYLDMIQKLPGLFSQDFNGDVEAYVKSAVQFTSHLEPLKLKGGLYVSKIPDKEELLQYGFREGDIFIGFKEGDEIHPLMYSDNTNLIDAYLSPEENVEVIFLRWDGEKYVKNSVIIRDESWDSENMGLILYEI